MVLAMITMAIILCICASNQHVIHLKLPQCYVSNIFPFLNDLEMVPCPERLRSRPIGRGLCWCPVVGREVHWGCTGKLTGCWGRYHGKVPQAAGHKALRSLPGDRMQETKDCFSSGSLQGPLLRKLTLLTAGRGEAFQHCQWGHREQIWNLEEQNHPQHIVLSRTFR